MKARLNLCSFSVVAILFTALAFAQNLLASDNEGSIYVPCATFQGLGFLPGGSTSQAYDVSSDGTVVVGSSKSVRGTEAFRWTVAGGMEGLGSIPGPVFSSQAWSVSADGNTIVGQAAGSGAMWQPFVWTRSGGMTSLGFSGFAYGVSGDGSVVVGVDVNQGFAWTGSEGLQLGLGSQAFRVSEDGKTVIGSAGSSAFRWTRSGGMQFLSGGWTSEAWGVSADGGTVVGRYQSAAGYQAAAWNSSGALLGLGVLPGGYFSEAYAASADGSTIVGDSISGSGSFAFIWDSVHGMQDLNRLLTSSGIDLSGWTLTEAWGISDDGTVIIGNGVDPSGNTEAWIARIPEPSNISLVAIGACGWRFLHRRKR